jgi:hypothetical protein
MREAGWGDKAAVIRGIDEVIDFSNSFNKYKDLIKTVKSGGSDDVAVESTDAKNVASMLKLVFVSLVKTLQISSMNMQGIVTIYSISESNI